MRGGALEGALLRADAVTNFAVYGFYGLSVWVPGDAAGEDGLLATKLLKARVVRRVIVADLLARGLEPRDTGQSPHYDLVYLHGGGVDALVDAIIATAATAVINPHLDPDGGADR